MKTRQITIIEEKSNFWYCFVLSLICMLWIFGIVLLLQPFIPFPLFTRPESIFSLVLIVVISAIGSGTACETKQVERVVTVKCSKGCKE